MDENKLTENEAEFLTYADLAKRWKVCRSIVFQLTKLDGFPPKYRFGRCGVRFRTEHVRAFEEQRMAPLN